MRGGAEMQELLEEEEQIVQVAQVAQVVPDIMVMEMVDQEQTE